MYFCFIKQTLTPNPTPMKKNVTYTKSDLMKYAWKVFRANDVRTMEAWSACLKEAWNVAKTNPKGLKEVKPTFEYAYTTYYNEVCNFVYGKVGSREIAEDITSELFFKVRDIIPTFNDSKTTLKTWLKYNAYNALVSYWRLKGVSTTQRVSDWTNDEGEEVFQFVSDTDTDKVTDSNELGSRIAQAFETLGENHKRIAVLYFVDGMKYREIAEICNIPLGTVQATLSRCREKLQSKLGTEAKLFGVA